MTDWIICSDFDGTICIPDSSEFLLDRFASEEWKKLDDDVWEGQITEREGFQRQIELLRVTWPEARAALREGVRIRPGFKEFVEWTQAQSLPFIILSSGLRPLIDELLALAGVPDVQIESHGASIDHDRWELILHNGQRLEEHCSHCKCAHLLKYCEAGKRVIYIGDGYTDLCPSKFADVLFATDRLAAACKANRLPFHPFTTFHDVKQVLDSLLHLTIQEPTQ